MKWERVAYNIVQEIVSLQNIITHLLIPSFPSNLHEIFHTMLHKEIIPNNNHPLKRKKLINKMLQYFHFSLVNNSFVYRFYYQDSQFTHVLSFIRFINKISSFFPSYPGGVVTSKTTNYFWGVKQCDFLLWKKLMTVIFDTAFEKCL